MKPAFIIIDLFCGAGGTTLGFEQAANGIAKVVACVNHDPIAIKSHWTNNKKVKHYEEDIRSLDLTALVKLINKYRKKYPKAKVILWASLECTNFSKAKGGLPRKADSRTLAYSLNMKWIKDDNYKKGESYIQLLDPDYIMIENVVEFMSWGPLDKNGKPVSMKKGKNWIGWRKDVCKLGYNEDWKQLNAANFGAYTSRNRLYGLFSKPGLPIMWPEQTHAKKVDGGLFDDLKKWKPVRDVLDLKDEGASIFTRKKPLVPKTMKRIYAGLIKYVAGGEKEFMSKYYSGDPDTKNSSTKEPAGTITTIDHHSLVFLTHYFSQGGQLGSIDDPSSTLTTKDRTAAINVMYWLDKSYSGPSNHQDVDRPTGSLTTKDHYAVVRLSQFLDKQYGGDENHQSIDRPAGTILANDKHVVITSKHFLDRNFSQGTKHQPIDQPAGTLLTVPKMNLVGIKKFIMDTSFSNGPRSIDEPMGVVTANRKHHYIVNPSWGVNANSDVDKPSPVIIARQDKAPLYLVATEPGRIAIPIFEDDCEYTIKIKEFMVLYDILDIKMRMLKVVELKLIQGFPKEYILLGTKTNQKKFIGNSQHPKIVTVWIESIHIQLINLKAA